MGSFQLSLKLVNHLLLLNEERIHKFPSLFINKKAFLFHLRAELVYVFVDG